MVAERPEVVLVPLEYLDLAPENTRQEADLEALEALKASILEGGLLQNLVGYEAGERVLVVAGGHRLRALRALAAEGHPVGEVPVRLVPREKALILSVTENLARKDLDPLEEAEAVGKLLEAGLSPESAARELGRSPAWVRARGEVARNLSPSWRPHLKAREIPFALAAELALLPREEQEDLHRRFGPALKPEALRAMRLEGGVPTSRALPGVEEAYREAGGTVEADLEGRTYFTDRALFLKAQAEAARGLAAKLGGELLLDVPATEFETGGGDTYVVLYTDTGEVRLFVQARRRSRKPEAEGPRPEAPLPAPKPEAPLPASTAPREEKAVSERGKAERVALRLGANRRRALEDPAYAKAALVLEVLALLDPMAFGYHHKAPFVLKDRAHYGAHAAPLERWGKLTLEGELAERLKGFAKAHGFGQETAVEDLLALEGGELEEAFSLALALLVGIPRERDPRPVRVGEADLAHLACYGRRTLEEAARALGVVPGATKKETAERILGKGNSPLPEVLMEAK